MACCPIIATSLASLMQLNSSFEHLKKDRDAMQAQCSCSITSQLLHRLHRLARLPYILYLAGLFRNTDKVVGRQARRTGASWRKIGLSHWHLLAFLLEPDQRCKLLQTDGHCREQSPT